MAPPALRVPGGWEGLAPYQEAPRAGAGGGRQRALFCQWQRPPARERWHLGSGQAAKPHTIHQERALGKFQAEHLRQIAGKFKSHCVVCSQALVGGGTTHSDKHRPPPSPPTGGRTPKVPSQPGSGGCSGTSSQSAEWNQGCGGQERKELLLLRFLLVLFKAVVIHWKCQGDSIFSRLPRRRGHGQIAGSTPAPHTSAWKTSTFSRYSWWNRLARQWKGAS